MPAQKPEADVSTPCAEYDAMCAAWEMLGDVHAGSEAIRQKADVYIPRHEAEPHEAYIERVEHALVYNFLRQTVDDLTGRAFTKPPEWTALADDSEWTKFLANVDRSERDGVNFARHWFRSAILSGLAWVYVETPAEGEAPVWTLIDPRDVHFIAIGDDGQFSEARFKRDAVTIDDFEEVISQEIVRITRDRLEIWRLSDTKKQAWELHKTDENAAGVVSLVPFAPEPISRGMYVNPPLIDLAELNVSHTRKLSDYDTSLRVSSFPMLSIQTPDGEHGSLVVGPHALLSLDPDCSASFVEHGGTALEALRNNLKDLEDRAGTFGAKMLKRRPSVETATARMVDMREASAPLQSFALGFEDALKQLIALTAKLWPAGGDSPGVAVNIDFLAPEGDTQTLISLRQLGDLSRLDLVAELQRRSVLGPRFDAGLNEQRIAEETPLMFTAKRGHSHDAE